MSGAVLGLSPIASASAAIAVVAIGAAVVTDVARRRIPNLITFPAMGAGLILAAVIGGGWGLAGSLAGATLAPCILMALRLGKPLGGGDIKLAAAVGALTGPAAGALAMLLAAVAGGLVALLWMLRPGTAVARTLAPFVTGFPILGRLYADERWNGRTIGAATIPYGVAIGIGSLAAIALAGTR